jgi:hypothetical protein
MGVSSDSLPERSTTNYRGQDEEADRDRYEQQKAKEQLEKKKGVKKQQWVQCERRSCGKWRKVPGAVDHASLPDKWFCEMNYWDHR